MGVCAGGGVVGGRKVLRQLAASPHLQIPSLDQALPCTPLPLSDPITVQNTVEHNFLCLYVEWGGGWILDRRWVTDDLPIFLRAVSMWDLVHIFVFPAPVPS